MGGAELDFDPKRDIIAAVMARVPQGNLHAGLLYRSPGGGCSVLHLGWEDQMYDDWGWTRLWAQPDVDREFLRTAAGYCRQIWDRYSEEQRFPYALKYLGATFSSEGILRTAARGLTCATLILAVFAAAGVVLVDEADWPIRTPEDRKFLEFVRPYATKVNAAHFAMLEREVDSGTVRRIWPDEVIGACACELPARFSEAREAADLALQKLPH